MILAWTPDLKFYSNVRADRPSKKCCTDAPQMFKATEQYLSVCSYIHYIIVFLEEKALHQNKWIHVNKFSVWSNLGVSLPKPSYDKIVLFTP